MPSTRIYFFSGTGNSLWAARFLAERLGDCSLEPMVGALDGGAPIRPQEERIGLVFPVYMYRMPFLVVRFIRALETSAPVFVLATCGGDPGDFLVRVESLLAERGIALRSGHCLPVQSNYLPFGGAPEAPELAERLELARARIEELAKIIAADSEEVEREFSRFRAWVHPGLLYRLGYAMVPQTDSKFTVDDRCNDCGLCAKVCPVGNVELVDGRPKWKGHCEQCLACLQYCPCEAIEVGEKTRGWRRYHHPEIKAKDIVAQKG